MPLYLDVHEQGEGSREALSDAHQRGLEIQTRLGAKYLTCWYDDQRDAVVYLLAAPTIETARAVHRETHGVSSWHLVELDEGALWRRPPCATEAVRAGGAEAEQEGTSRQGSGTTR